MAETSFHDHQTSGQSERSRASLQSYRHGDSSSLSKFARSIRRAAAFRDPTPVIRAVVDGQDPDELEDPTQDRGQQAENHKPDDVEAAHHQADENTPLLSSKLDDGADERTKHLRQQRDEARAQRKEEDREPMLVKRIHRADGTSTEVIVGQSTMPHTVFNSSNVLIGVGMLSLPLGFRYSGWAIGLTFLVASAFTTKYTASLLAKCVDVDSSLANFADIAFVAFGERGRAGTSVLFTLELTAACVALVTLFADSLSSLVPGRDTTELKIICGFILMPLNFVPMKWLSVTSFMGIFCGLSLILIVFIDGMLKHDAPGSLHRPMPTHILPQHWRALPLSFGLIMAPWGGHSVFTNIYRDMRHPWRYERALKYTFTFTTSFDIVMAVLGLLMFGKDTLDEITTNILQQSGYPHPLNVLTLVLIAIVPLTKFPLNCSPIISTLEVLFLIDPRAAQLKPNMFNTNPFLSRMLKALFRVGIVVIIVVLSILIPSFEVISAIMGAAFCFTICVILPAAFHLKMFGHEMPRKQKWLDWVLIAMSVVLGMAGTVWQFLDKEWMGIGK